jgi:RIO kinase 1
MVRTWAEKEMRNLARIHASGVPCPQPFVLRSHVLVMAFVGTDGVPAPLLKDVEVNQSKARELYLDMLIYLRKLFHVCHLIHADLSEFNILYQEGKQVIIDVSQSVEQDHPHALEFLRKDCSNITDFFRKKGVGTMTVRELFDFVTDPTITDENMDDYLERMQQIASQRTEEERSELEKVDEEVFMRSFIPKRLDEVLNVERDIQKSKAGDHKEILYHTLTGLQPDLSRPQMEPAVLEIQGGDMEPVVVQTQGDDKEPVVVQTTDAGTAVSAVQVAPLSESGESGSSSDDDSEDESEEGEGSKDKHSASGRPRDESPNSKRERKQAVKEAKREKRKTKIKKHVKKRKEKVGKQK